VSTTLDREEKRVIEAGKEEWRQRTGSSVLDIQIPSPNEGSWVEEFWEKEREEEGSLAGGEKMR
jgi:hypothetical protein